MVKKSKIKAVENLTKKIDESYIIGVLDMFKIPSKQYQEIQKQLRNETEFLSIKKSIFLHALEKSKKKQIKDIIKDMPIQPLLIFSKINPFKFYVKASKLKSPNYAKAGDITENEIEVNAGPTDLMPGPAIAEFSKVKIPTGVDNGKIAIKKDKVVAVSGDVISENLANILRKLKIQPMKVGLNIVSIYDDGIIYPKDILSLAGEGYINQTIQAHQQAVNMTVFVGYPTKENIGILLVKANMEAQALNSKLPTKVENKENTSEQKEVKSDKSTSENKEESKEELKVESKQGGN